jgi:hypothetical protein
MSTATAKEGSGQLIGGDCRKSNLQFFPLLDTNLFDREMPKQKKERNREK